MALSELQIDLIGKYISNSLSESEDKEFRAQLNDQTFRDELWLQGQMVDILSDAKDQELKEYLRQYRKDEDTKKSSFFLEPYIKYAAVFVLLIGGFFLFKQFSGDTSIDSLALIEKYDSRYPAELVQRGVGSEMSQEYKIAMSIYANQRYADAYAAFDVLKDQSPKIQLFKVNSLIEQKKYEEAIDLLKSIEGDDIEVTGVSENRDWYLAMSYLGNNNIKKAIAQLEQISKSESHVFKGKAKKILTELKG